MKILKIAIVMFFGMTALAFSANGVRQAVLQDAKGIVEIRKGQEVWMPLKKGDVLAQGDIIRTKAASAAVIRLEGTAEKSIVELKENTQMKLAEMTEDVTAKAQSTLLDVALGSILVKAEKLRTPNSKFEVKTPTSIVGVRGTTFSVTVEAIE